MKSLKAPVYALFIAAGLVTSQKCPNCPDALTVGGLAIAATCSSVLASSLHLRNDACAKQIRRLDSDCKGNNRDLFEAFATCTEQNVALNEELENLRRELEEQRQVVAYRSLICRTRFLTHNEGGFEECLDCITISDPDECDGQAACVILATNVCVNA
ncbi:uncharacterized protein LOC128191659 [Crassostrea angulata]|uniref:uncharacterized protein LOC128191659 n=1 Tax=Magallana angulata TaxID=2784310 RepID=UPI0022B1A222|nr:uncharacterized protein LOC128191659 [Crassostrea angulata]